MTEGIQAIGTAKTNGDALDFRRCQVKLYATDPGAVDREAAVQLFHRFIRDDVLDELVIDVADYGHVHRGPGVILVGHAVDISLDQSEGRPGFLYSWKRDLPGDATARLTETLRRALQVARRIEEDGDIGVTFDPRELRITLPDRLHVRNDQATMRALTPLLRALIERIHPGGAMSLVREGTARDPFTARVTLLEGDPSLVGLAERLS